MSSTAVGTTCELQHDNNNAILLPSILSLLFRVHDYFFTIHDNTTSLKKDEELEKKKVCRYAE
jgi:hypothetical protein